MINIKSPNLTGYQKDWLYDPARFVFTEACTKAGKTHSHLWWIYERAHESWNKKGNEHWWVAPGYSQTEIAFKRLKRRLDSRAYRINNSKLTITCPNGAVIMFKTAKDPDALFGEDVHSVVFDEAPRAKKEAWYALRTTITATKGLVRMIGNFGGVSNWMHQLKEKAKTDPAYSYYRITATQAIEAGILDQDEVDQARADLPSKVFLQLYMAEAQKSDDQLVEFDAMESMFTNDYVTGGSRYITADIALHGSDKFVLLVWEGLKILKAIIVDKCDAKQVEELIKSVATEYKVPRRNITYDADGLGSFLRGYLSGAKPFNNGAKPYPEIGKSVNYNNLKSQCGYKLAELLNADQIWWADQSVPREDILAELECLQSYALDQDGKIRLMPKKKIIEILGHSPDILDALIMRMIFLLAPKVKLTGSSVS